MLQQIDHVQLPVSDLGQAIEWYTTHLGFSVLHHEDKHHAVLRLEEGPTLFLWRTGDVTAATFTVDGQPFPTIGVRASDIGALHERLATAGVHITMFQDEGFGMVMKFFDPYGNMWVAYEPHAPN
jgi:catechol 2,3-dioxygenase-like lactoylglutathione lyase family enzyme